MDPKHFNIDEIIDQQVVPWLTVAQQYAPIVLAAFVLVVAVIVMRHQQKRRRKERRIEIEQG